MFDLSDDVGYNAAPGGGHAPARPAPKMKPAPFVREHAGKTLADYYNTKRESDAEVSESMNALGPAPGGAGRERSAGTFAGAATPTLDPSKPDYSQLAGMVGYDSEAAKILRQLYGRPKLSAPVPKPAMRTWEAAGSWQRPMHAPEAEDPRELKINREAQALLEATRPPAIPVKEVHVPAIDLVTGHRKTAAQIEAELAAAELNADISGPPMKRGFNTEAEKRKLQSIFALKGGRALPESGMPEALEGHLPLQMLMGKRPSRGAARTNVVPKGAGDVAQQFDLGSRDAAILAAARPDELRLFSECHNTSQELLNGIVECRGFIEEMSALGALPPERRAMLEGEISSKQADLAHVRKMVAQARQRIAARVPAAPAAPPAAYRPVSADRPLQRAGHSAMQAPPEEPAAPSYPYSGPRIVSHHADPSRAARSIDPSPMRSPPKGGPSSRTKRA